MSAAAIFIDTNLLVYPQDRAETVKGPHADLILKRIFAAGRPLISVQVLSEFYWIVTRKIPSKLTHDEAIAEVLRLNILTRVVPLTWAILDKALQAVPLYGLPLWDAQIFAASVLNGATFVLSEDFQHRRVVEGVTFLNPFDPSFDLSALSIP
jgi:predicted nucleic acid-binding protein